MPPIFRFISSPRLFSVEGLLFRLKIRQAYTVLALYSAALLSPRSASPQSFRFKAPADPSHDGACCPRLPGAWV